MKIDESEIVLQVKKVFPNVQVVYLFGSYAAGNPWPHSDVDIALLLPPEESKKVGYLSLSFLRGQLEDVLKRDVDLINLRQVSTVFQKEIVMGGRRIDCHKPYSADEFEMLVLSFYQKLNEERAEVMAEGLRSGKFYKI